MCDSPRQLLLLLLTPIFITWSAEAGRSTLIQFGRDDTTTQTPYPNWKTTLRHPLRSRWTDSDSTSPEHWGIVETPDIPEGQFSYFGVTGTDPIPLRRGCRILATFYNQSESTEYLAARISFTDSDEPDQADASKPWFTLRCRDYTPVDTGPVPIPVAPRTHIELEFYIADTNTVTALGMLPTEGEARLVNISKPDNHPLLVLTRIEWSDDADFTPPHPPSILRAEPWALTAGCGMNLVRLTWTPALDPGTAASGISRYFIYRNGQFYDSVSSDLTSYLGDQPSYIDLCVEPNREYEYAITAVDRAPVGIHPTPEHPNTRHGNESLPSATVRSRTPEWTGPTLIHPSIQARHEGVVRLPYTDDEPWAFASAGLAYYPQGNAQHDAAQELPGSLFALTRMAEGIAELSIPRPSPSARTEDWPIARELQSPTNLWPAVYGGRTVPEGGGDRVAGLAFHPGARGLPDMLYYGTCNFYGTDPLAPAHGAWNLNLTQTVGPWHLGAAPPNNIHPALLSKVLFTVPSAWAQEHTGGRSLIVGNTFLSGCGVPSHGPSLYAIAPWETGAWPAPGAAISTIELIRYSSGDALPQRMVNWTQDQYAEGGAWISVGHAAAIALSHRRPVGETWYGDLSGGTLYEFNIPEPPGYGRGVGAADWRASLLLYNPDDLSEVAAGRQESWYPQPYLVFDLDQFSRMPGGGNGEAGAITYDSAHNRLFFMEHNGDPGIEWGYSLIHTWQFADLPPIPRLEIHQGNDGLYLLWPTANDGSMHHVERTHQLSLTNSWESLSPPQRADGTTARFGPLTLPENSATAYFRIRIDR